jgi:outer membrane lipoprotein-sorting protein
MPLGTFKIGGYMKKSVFVLALIFGMNFPVDSSALETANELLKRVDSKLMPESYEAYRRLINEEPNGKKKEYTFFTLKKGTDKVALLYLAPASEKGRSTLRLGENMWLFIPNVNKPVRITSLQSVVGGVFNNADIMAVEYSAEYDAEYDSETSKERILNLKAKNKTVTYDKLKMWITKNGEYLRKVECYGSSGVLIKTLEFKDDKSFGGGIFRPSVIETHSPLYKDYRSTIIYEKIRAKKIQPEAFTLPFMGRLKEFQ